VSRDHDRPGPPDREAGRPGSPSLEQDFDSQSLHALRSAVAAHAAAAGLGRQRVYDITAVAHELAANTIRHGPGHGRLRLWAADGRLYCQVSDDGAAPSGDRQPMADPGSWQPGTGHGLWLVGQVADKLTIDRGPAGVTVTVTFATASDPAARPLPAPRAGA
jgi:anti-sigma regulatory factor (Ser/Thr protein kinase)